ncbi:methyltransferase [soil metagenome]
MWHSGDMGPVRDDVMWQAVQDAVAEVHDADGPLHILDLGGGTGGASVRLAEAGHFVTVVDPSPDALASLERRAAERSVSDRVVAVLGDAADLSAHVEPGSCDLALCHGVLEHVDDYDEALDAVVTSLRPGGVASVVVAGRLAAIFSRAMAGDFATARTLLDASLAGWELRRDGPRKFTRDEVERLLDQHGLTRVRIDGLRTFVDHVPSAYVDAEPGARDALRTLEHDVARVADFTTISTSLHALARLD